VGGCPHALNEQDEHAILHQICSGKFNIAVDIEKSLREHNNISVSAQTVQNILKKNGLKAIVKKKNHSF
jgi:hypothetical protein